MESYLLDKSWADTNLLLMSSGHFGDMDLQDIANRIVDSVK
jgi:hypothetical protein